jgi:hypothetical protein
MWYHRSLVIGGAALLAAFAACTAQTAKKTEPPAEIKVSPPAMAVEAVKSQQKQPAEKAVQPEPGQQFTRLSRDANRQPLALETAIVTYVPQNRGQAGPTIDLIAAVHVADGSYYDRLNELFAKYDVVLYELVAPEGTKFAKGARPPSQHPVTIVQNVMTSVLALQFQLDSIDYAKANMVHADMSPKQLAEAIDKSGESVWAMFFRIMVYAMARQGYGDDIDTGRWVLALLDKNRALAMKRLMAEEMQDLDGTMAAIDGPKGSALISGRNKVALEVLRKQIAAGKNKIAIFYGAGHMPGMGRSLRDDFHLEPTATRWLVAWDLKGEAAGSDKVTK